MAMLIFFVLFNNSRTRVHNFKLFKKPFCLDLCKYFFSNSIISTWRNLPKACLRMFHDLQNEKFSMLTNSLVASNSLLCGHGTGYGRHFKNIDGV